MATISSAGIGSGLDVKSIVSQLVALEKQPLVNLQTQAATVQSKISAFGQIQAQFAALGDVANRISSASTWSARTVSVSNTAAASVTVTGTADATSFSLDVDSLAQQQSLASATLTAGGLVGAGTMTLRLGTWSGSGSSFAPASGSADVAITVEATDTVATLAAKINKSNAGVVATAFNDGTNDRLLLRSKDTGAAAGFRVQVTDADAGADNDGVGLSRFAFDPESGAFGMASAGLPVTYGADAQARINGLAVTSKTNTLTGNIPGVTINLLATTTKDFGLGTEVKNPTTIAVKEDVTVAVKNVNDFVKAYNDLNATLRELTKYDAATKTSSLFQGDSTVLGLQSVLRSMAGSISTGSQYQRLSDVGIERQLDGSLSVNTSKLSTAANNGTQLQQLFTTDNSDAAINGFALKFNTLAKGVLATSGTVTTKNKALQGELDRNAKEQTKVNTRASNVEARLTKQYSALDTKMAGLNALSSYVAQQVTTWNKSTE
jgi:flagellar hook-associated protein 2